MSDQPVTGDYEPPHHGWWKWRNGSRQWTCAPVCPHPAHIGSQEADR